MFVYRLGRLSYPDGFCHPVKGLKSARLLESLRPAELPSRYSSIFATPVLEEIFRWVGIKDLYDPTDWSENLSVWKLEVKPTVKVFSVEYYDDFCHSVNYGYENEAKARGKVYWQYHTALSEFEPKWCSDFSEVLLNSTDILCASRVSSEDLVTASYSGNPVLEFGSDTDKFLDMYSENFK